ncbi:MAG: hypothetical protein E6J62_10650, partial [Deltaproteobacteria bacterium]
PGVVFLLNAASFVAVVFVLYRWERIPTDSGLPAEHAGSAVRAGLRYLRHAPDFQAVLMRTGLFVVSASAVWALLPLVGRQSLGLDSLGYGLLVGALGTGAVLMAMVLPRVRARLSVDQLVWIATAAFALVAFTLAFVHVAPLVYLAMALAGAAWISTMSSFNVAAQLTSASWVRSRALAAYSIAFQGGLALGSALWGTVASRFGIGTALAIAGVGLLVGLAVSRGYPLTGREDRDLSPSMHWPQPLLVPEARPSDGPVLVVIEYFVSPENAVGLPGRRRPHPVRGDVPRRVVDRAPAPAPPRHHGRPRDRAPHPQLLHRGEAGARPASVARPAAGEETNMTRRLSTPARAFRYGCAG